MARTSVSLRLREKLGQEASEDLALAIENAKDDMLAVCQDKFEARLQIVSAALREDMSKLDANLRVAMAEGFSGLRTKMSEMRVEMIRMSFLFWLGQFVALVAALGYMLRGFTR
jgi:hypothetical protein